MEHRIAVVEGRRTVVVERRPPLQPNLELLRRAMRVTFEVKMPRAGGARVSCTRDREHRLVRFLEGRHVGTDGVVRDLRCLMCRDCEAVCVRDVSISSASVTRPDGSVETVTHFGSRRPLARRDEIIGWYSGARPGQREYR